MGRNHRTWGMGTVVLLASILVAPVKAMGATKPISSVSIQVSSKMEPREKLPEIETGSGNASEGKVRVHAGGKYHVEKAERLDKSSMEAKVGDEPRMKVTLEPEDVGENYLLTAYKEPSVKISGEAFVSVRRDGGSLAVTSRLKPVKGDFDPPKDVYQYEKDLGEARWDKPENTSGYYEPQLYRDNKSVHKASKVFGARYDFYPYMTKEGDYTFKVRTVSDLESVKEYGGKNEWIGSGEFYTTDRYVSDGKGQQAKDSTFVRGTQETVGWNKEGDSWFYRYPDDSLCRGRRESIKGQWYYFNIEGIMQAGWQLLDSRYLHLYPNEQMAVGWAEMDGKRHYFCTGEGAGETAGSMQGAGWRAMGPYYYHFNRNGFMYTGWSRQDGKQCYLNTVDNSLKGALFTGWIKQDGKTYFADSNGEIVEGWCQIDGNWYCFYPRSGGLAYNTVTNGFHVSQDEIWERQEAAD